MQNNTIKKTDEVTMEKKDKVRKMQIAPPFATGGGGIHFENRVQSIFAVLMLEGGKILDLPPLPIEKIQFQARQHGYCIDDQVILLGKNDSKILCQIKHQIKISDGDENFAQVIRDAWEDFNSNLFSQKNDFIFLITGPLSAKDIEHTRPLLEWAREMDSGEEFANKVASKASSTEKEKKLNVFRNHLKLANNNTPLKPNELLNFLKRFYLISLDLDIKSSVIKSLIRTIIGDSDIFESSSILAKIKDEVEHRNANGASITIENFPQDIQTHFREKRIGKKIPLQFATQIDMDTNYPLEGNEFEMISSVLFGSWDLNSRDDIKRLSDLLEHDVTRWSKLFPPFFLNEAGPVCCRTGKCEVKDRLAFWKTIGPRISDKNLDLFKNAAITVLSERDPKLDLSSDNRFASKLFKKEFNHSLILRKGIADTLALMGCKSEHLIQCTKGKSKVVASEVVYELLYNGDWETWASLNSLLPILAEASPEQFIRSFEKLIKRNPNSIDSLYAQSSSGIIGTNYINGILWALETIAWGNNLFVDSIVNIAALGVLSRNNIKGNQPINSLVEIFLPWSPHTTASVEKRMTGLKTLKKEYPELTWKLLLKLLGNQRLTSFGTRSPFWRLSLLEDWKDEISNEAYRQSIQDIGSLAIEMGKESLIRLGELCNHIAELPIQALIEIIPVLNSKDIKEMSEEDRLPIWHSLMTLVAKHRRFHDADWAMNSTNIDSLTQIAIILQPNTPTLFYKHMFIDENYFIINGSSIVQAEYDEQENIREQAIKRIIQEQGYSALVNFSSIVWNPLRLGFTLGQLESPIDVSKILPDLIDSETRHLFLMAKGFVQSSFEKFGWKWVKKQPYSKWTPKQKGLFFSALPFSKQIWEKIKKVLILEDRYYWKNVEIKLTKNLDCLDLVISKLIEHDRLIDAIECIAFTIELNQFCNTNLAIKALLASRTSKCKLTDNEMLDVLKIIDALQKTSDVNNDDLIAVESTFLSIKRHYPEFKPLGIEKRLTMDPGFFCEIVKSTYRSDKNKNSEKKISDQQQTSALLTWNLLRDWTLPPGMTTDNNFSRKNFESWLGVVKAECERTGYLKVAMNCIGRVLVNVPKKDSNFPMNRDIAEILSDNDSRDMLQGYENGILELHHIKTINPPNHTEEKISLKYQEYAAIMEEHNYYRIATMFREIADYFEDKAIWLAENF